MLKKKMVLERRGKCITSVVLLTIIWLARIGIEKETGQGQGDRLVRERDYHNIYADRGWLHKQKSRLSQGSDWWVHTLSYKTPVRVNKPIKTFGESCTQSDSYLHPHFLLVIDAQHLRYRPQSSTGPPPATPFLTFDWTSALWSFWSSSAADFVSSLRAAMCSAGRRTFPFVSCSSNKETTELWPCWRAIASGVKPS